MQSAILSQLQRFLINVEEQPIYVNSATQTFLYKAWFIHNKKQVTVAAKIIAVEIEKSGQKIHEALVTSRLEDEPRVMKIYTVEQWLNTSKTTINVCIVAEFCEGMSLDKEILRRATESQPWTDT